MRGWHIEDPYPVDVPFYPGPKYRPPPKPVRSFTPGGHEGTQSSHCSEIANMDPGVTLDFKENSPFQEGVISEAYQRPDKPFFQEHWELNSLVNTSNLVQKFLPKQANIDKILKVIWRKVLKGMHLPVKIRAIQARYLNNPYFKRYLFISGTKYSQKGRNSRRTIHLIRLTEKRRKQQYWQFQRSVLIEL